MKLFLYFSLLNEILSENFERQNQQFLRPRAGYSMSQAQPNLDEFLGLVDCAAGNGFAETQTKYLILSHLPVFIQTTCKWHISTSGFTYIRVWNTY